MKLVLEAFGNRPFQQANFGGVLSIAGEAQGVPMSDRDVEE
jgi:hypothetical protein